jgi:hypothetical protein
VNLYTISLDDGGTLPGIDGVSIHGPLPRAGDVVWHSTFNDRDDRNDYKLRVLYVEHTLVRQATETLAASVVVYVEAL